MPALESINVAEIRTALNDPVDFLNKVDFAGLLEKLEQSSGPDAKHFAIAKLRPKLTKELHKQDLQWKEALLRSWNSRLRVD